MVQQVYVARFRRKFGAEDELSRYVSALYDMLASVIGQDKVVLRAGKVSALKMMRSQNLPDRLCGLQRLVFEDPTFERVTCLLYTSSFFGYRRRGDPFLPHRCLGCDALLSPRVDASQRSLAQATRISFCGLWNARAPRRSDSLGRHSSQASRPVSYTHLRNHDGFGCVVP